MAARAQVKLPKVIHASGLEWRVVVKRNLEHNGDVIDGLCDPNSQQIFLRAGVIGRLDRKRKTLLHEVLHAVLKSYVQYDDEQLIGIMEDALDGFIRNNPEFMRLYGYERS